MIRQASEWCCWGLQGPTVCLSTVQWSMVRKGLVCEFFCFVFFPFFFLLNGRSCTILKSRWKYFCEGATPTRVQAHFSTTVHTSQLKEWREWWRTNKGNLRPPSLSLSPSPSTRLWSSSAPSAGRKRHFNRPLVAVPPLNWFNCVLIYIFRHWFLCWGWHGSNPQRLAVMVWWMEQSQ